MLLEAIPGMDRVFAIYALFWVVVLVALIVGVGLLLKRHDRLSAGAHPPDETRPPAH